MGLSDVKAHLEIRDLLADGPVAAGRPLAAEPVVDRHSASDRLRRSLSVRGVFAGDVIFERIANKPALRRVGLAVEGKRPVREGQSVVDAAGEVVGEICSACYGASVGGPIAMAYVSRPLGEPGTALQVDVRGKMIPVTVTRMPFTPQRYFRG